jgi:hypothetical protein
MEVSVNSKSDNKKLKTILEKLTHKKQVSLALYFAEDVFYLVSDKNRPILRMCLDTTRLWLEGKASIAELYIAVRSAADANAAAYAAYAAAYAANAAADAANAADAAASSAAARSAAAAADAANAAADAANAADAAARSAAAADANAADIYKSKMKKYLKYVEDSLTNIERILWRIDETQN